MQRALQTILTIDDDDDIRAVAAMVLKRKGGFDVTSMASGYDALAYLEAQSQMPDLILLDVMMPMIDGPQTLKLFRDKAPHPMARIPIVFMTAKCQPDEVERLIALGAANVIPKPFDVANLVGDLQQIWVAL